jgi:hypothetical protein
MDDSRRAGQEKRDELQRELLRRWVRADQLLVARAQLLGELAALLGGVDREALACWLVEHNWDQDGGPERALAAIQTLRNAHQRRAAEMKRDLRRSPVDVREMVSSLRRQHPEWTTKKAIEEIAKSRKLTPKRISNLLYGKGS